MLTTSPLNQFMQRDRVALGPFSTQPPQLNSILLVEPRGEVYARLASDLRSIGIRVVRATDAASALRFFSASQCDLMITSDDLPDIPGRFLCGRLRWSHPRVRVWLYRSKNDESPLDRTAIRMANRVIPNDGDLWNLSDRLLRFLVLSAVA